MIALDTSMAVAVALPWHEAHAAARAALPATRTRLVAHVGIETYSVLTRLPPPQRVPAAVAREYLAEAFDLPPLALPAGKYRLLLDLVASEEITGGAVYDALVAATCRHAGATLLTLDRRATGVYRRLDVDYRLVS